VRGLRGRKREWGTGRNNVCTYKYRNEEKKTQFWLNSVWLYLNHVCFFIE
jgi:hypothetical protein